MDDIGTTQITLGIFGTASLSFLIFLVMQSVKDFAPNLRDRGAAVAVHIVSLAAVAAALFTAGADWLNAVTWISLIVGMFAAAVIARGYYALLFKVSVEGMPPGPDASVLREDIREPYDDETRAPIAPAVRQRIASEAELTAIRRTP